MRGIMESKKAQVSLMNIAIGVIVAVMVFSILSIILFKEPLTLKTIICLLLSFCIVLVQLVMK